ncbi:MAG: hypothetical protein PVI21_03050 [Candidatus Woesebacteria bacterium]|jgi:hypothetical protein
MVAIRWWGLGASILSLSTAVAAVAMMASKILPVIAVGVALLVCAYWSFVVHNERVLTAAERYKEQFFKSMTLF